MNIFKTFKTATVLKIATIIFFTTPPALAADLNVQQINGTNAFEYKAPAKLDKATPALESVYLGFGATDLLTSLNLAPGQPEALAGYHEINPVLGLNPSILEYAIALPATFGVTTGIAMALFPRDRNPILLVAGAGEVYSVINNLAAGLGPLLYALPTVLIGVGVGIVIGIVTYYISKAILQHFHYYDHPPAPFVSKPWPLKGER